MPKARMAAIRPDLALRVMAEGLVIRLQAAMGLRTVATEVPAAEQTEEPADGFRAARADPMVRTEVLFWHLAGLGKAQRHVNLA